MPIVNASVHADALSSIHDLYSIFLSSFLQSLFCAFRDTFYLSRFLSASCNQGTLKSCTIRQKNNKSSVYRFLYIPAYTCTSPRIFKRRDTVFSDKTPLQPSHTRKTFDHVFMHNTSLGGRRWTVDTAKTPYRTKAVYILPTLLRAVCSSSKLRQGRQAWPACVQRRCGNPESFFP